MLTAGSCMELSEIFLGLGGDFPFILNNNKDKQFKAGNYEISGNFEVSQSDKNPECPSSVIKKIKTDDTMIPVCGTGESEKPATCKTSEDGFATAKCAKTGKNPVCTDKQGALLNNVKPVCESNVEEKPVCRDKAPKKEPVYTLTLKADNIRVIVESADSGSPPVILQKNTACLKIKKTQFDSLTVNLTATDQANNAHNKILCSGNNKCTVGHYEINTLITGGIITDSSMLSVSNMNPDPNCQELQ